MSHLIGIDLGATNAKAAVVTKDGKVIANVQESLGIDLSPDAVVSKLVKCASRALKEVEMDWKDVAGVGVGSPGGIDSKISSFSMTAGYAALGQFYCWSQLVYTKHSNLYQLE